MASLSALPDEVVELIFNCFDRKHDQKRIRALRATNRRFCRLTASRRWVTIADPHHHEIKHGNWLPSHASLLKWACKVVDRPEYACTVKEIREPHRRINLPPLLQSDDEKAAAEITRRPAKRWAATLKRSGLPEGMQERICEELVENPYEACLPFLLAMCKHTEVLELETIPKVTNELASLVLLEELPTPAKQQQPTTPLHAPRHISDSIRTLHIGRPSGTTDLLSLLALPCLQTFEAPYLGDGDDFAWSITDAVTSKHGGFNALSFWSDICAISHNGLRQILVAAAPTSIALRWIDDTSTDHIESYMPMGDTIRSHGASLESLHLDMSLLYYAGHDPMNRSASYGSFGSFAQLPRLRSLAVGMHAFIGVFHDPVSVLPPTLEELYILGVGKDLRTFNYSDEDEDVNDNLDVDNAAGNQNVHSEEEYNAHHGQVDPAESNEDHQTGNLHTNDAEAAVPIDGPLTEDPDPPGDPPAGETRTTEEDLGDDEHVDRLVAALQNASERLPRLRRIVRVPWRNWRRWPEDNVHRCIDYEASGELPFRNVEYMPGVDRNHILVT